MKKFFMYFSVVLVSGLILFLASSHSKSKLPNTFYQVYLDGEQLGMINSRRELENYIDSQANVIRENVRDYEKKINALDDFNELVSSMDEGKIGADYPLFVNMADEAKVTYMLSNKDACKISDAKYSNLKYYNSNRMWNLSDKEIKEIRDYYDNNKIYLESDKIYIPNGIEMKEVKTYKTSLVSTEAMYKKIIEKKNCTIPGYKFTIHSDNKDKEVYVTDKKIFSDSIDTMASIFIGDNAYNQYKEDNQPEIESTGDLINNVYVDEDISYKAVNISTDEKIYTDSTELVQFLLYGDNHNETTVSVNEGDSISSIAYNNQISVEEFLISNPEYTSEDNLLYTGKQVKIAKVDPQINIVEEKYSVIDVESNYNTVEVYDSSMTQGDQVVTQEGETGIERVSQNVKVVNGEIAYVEPVSKQTIKSSIDRKITVGTKVTPHIGSTSSWGWPTSQGDIV